MNKDLIQEQALKAILPFKQGTIVLSTGMGKTLTAIKHLEKLYFKNIKVLVVASKKSIFKSWFDELDKHNKNYLKENITFSTYRSLTKVNLNDYDLIYLDECHNLTIDHYNFLKDYQGYLIGLTGTPPNIEYTRGILYNKYIPTRFEYLLDNAIKDNLLNDYRIIVHLLEVDDRKNLKVTTKQGKTFFTSEKKTLDYWNKVCSLGASKITSIGRLSAIKNFNSKADYAKKLMLSLKSKTLIFANTTEQADYICNFSYHSKNSKSSYNLDLFNQGKITKLSTVEQISEGINMKDLKTGIILHSYSGNSAKSRQKLGRLLRLNPLETCTLHILCYKNTVDETWLLDALSHFSQDKIKYFDAKTNTFINV